MYQPPSSLLHNTHFASSSPSAETAKSATSLLMLDAFTSAVGFHNFAGCSASGNSPFSVPSMLPHGPSSSSAPHSLCSPPSSSSGTSSSSLSLAHPSLMPSGKRERTKYSEQQLSYLESSFKRCKYPDVQVREQIAKSLQLTDVKVQVWFKNRRAKDRQEMKLEQIRTGVPCHGTNAPPSAQSTAHGAFVKGEKRRIGEQRTGTKREESVEDTEEENQQPPRKKTLSSGGPTEAERGELASSSCLFPSSASAQPSSDRQRTAHSSSAPFASVSASPSSSSFPLSYDLPKGLLIPQIDPIMYSSNLPPSSSSSAPFGPVSTSCAEMGSLMAVASNFSPQVPSLYGGWSLAPGYASAGFLSSSYVPPGQASQQLAPFVQPSSAYYQQTNNYYFNNGQQSAAQRIELEPKNERE